MYAKVTTSAAFVVLFGLAAPRSSVAQAPGAAPTTNPTAKTPATAGSATDPGAAQPRGTTTDTPADPTSTRYRPEPLGPPLARKPWLAKFKRLRLQRRAGGGLFWFGLATAVLPAAICLGVGRRKDFQNRTAGKPLRIAGYALFGVAGAAVVLGAALYFLARSGIKALMGNPPSLADASVPPGVPLPDLAPHPVDFTPPTVQLAAWSWTF